MGEIDDLKSRLAEIQQKRKEDQEIKRLRKQIKAEEFSQTKSGKIFNKIADVGERITRPQKKKGSPKIKGKTKSISEVIRDLPQ